MMRRILFTSAVLGLGLLLVASGQGQTGLSEDEIASFAGKVQATARG